MKVTFQGILQAHIEELETLPEVAPKGLVYLDEDDLHITLLTNEELYPFEGDFRRAWKKHKDEIPPFPKVSYDKTPYIAVSYPRRSWALDLDIWSQIKVWYWLYQVLSIMGLEKKVKPSNRIFHVSLANKTGSKYDSISKPWLYRLIPTKKG